MLSSYEEKITVIGHRPTFTTFHKRYLKFEFVMGSPKSYILNFFRQIRLKGTQIPIIISASFHYKFYHCTDLYETIR